MAGSTAHDDKFLDACRTARRAGYVVVDTDAWDRAVNHACPHVRTEGATSWCSLSQSDHETLTAKVHGLMVERDTLAARAETAEAERDVYRRCVEAYMAADATRSGFDRDAHNRNVVRVEVALDAVARLTGEATDG